MADSAFSTPLSQRLVSLCFMITCVSKSWMSCGFSRTISVQQTHLYRSALSFIDSVGDTRYVHLQTSLCSLHCVLRAERQKLYLAVNSGFHVFCWHRDLSKLSNRAFNSGSKQIRISELLFLERSRKIRCFKLVSCFIAHSDETIGTEA